MATEHGLSIVSFNSTRLAFPLGEALGLQRSADLESASEPETSVPLTIGSIIHAEQRWPVFNLNADFIPMPTLSATTHHCLCLSADGGATGVALACETVETLSFNADAIAPTPLPTCMQRAATPLQQLYVYDKHILPISSAPALAAYLRSLMEQEHV